jgi:hypothetical protein
MFPDVCATAGPHNVRDGWGVDLVPGQARPPNPYTKLSAPG